MDDKELIGMFLRRDDNAVAEAERQYGDILSGLSMRITGDAHIAEECVNDALLRAWETIPETQPKNLAGYLIMLTRNISLNRYEELRALKRGGRMVKVAFSELHNVASHIGLPENELMQKELVSATERFARGLSESDRRILLGRVYYFLPTKEIAAEVEMTEGAVRARLARIRKKLRDYLKKEGWEV